MSTEKKTGLKITGGNILEGEVPISGAKNSTNHLFSAVLLTDQDCVIHNVPAISDTRTTIAILESLGANVEQIDSSSYVVNASGINSFTVPEDLALQLRPSIFLGALAGSVGQAVLPEPMGDRIGRRPLNWHLEALAKLGYETHFDGQHYVIQSGDLHPATIHFVKNTHTGTSNTIMAAVKIPGVTVLKNAAEEPEVDDLINFLNSMGAQISRTGSKEITINGVARLHGTEHIAIPDRNEAVTYACAALISGGDVLLTGVFPEHLEAFLEILQDMNAEYSIDQAGIRVWAPQNGLLRAVSLETGQHPGFMSDWQPMVTALLTQVVGQSIVIERVHSNRFQFTNDLNRMGAQIELFDPEVENPPEYYDFDISENSLSPHGCSITGPTPLVGIEARVNDIRAGAALILAGLSAQGETSLSNIGHLNRGYDSYVEKFSGLGADVEIFET